MIKNSLWFAPVMVLLVACGPDSGGGAASGSAAAATSAKPTASAKPSSAPAASATPAAPASSGSAAPAASGSAAAGGAVADADILPEMKDFLAGFKGKSTDVTASFKKHAKAGTKDADMGMYDMHDAKVVSMTKKDKQTCYNFDANAGMMVYTYEVCWDGGKIVSAAEKGSK